MTASSGRSRLNFMTRLLPISLILLAATAWAGEGRETMTKIPVPNTVTLVELGADNCIPCRLQKPVIAELEQEYQGRAAIVAIDVYRDQESARKFHVLIVPTIIFFNRAGQETGRHAGFMDKVSIVKELERVLAE